MTFPWRFLVAFLWEFLVVSEIIHSISVLVIIYRFSYRLLLHYKEPYLKHSVQAVPLRANPMAILNAMMVRYLLLTARERDLHRVEHQIQTIRNNYIWTQHSL